MNALQQFCICPCYWFVVLPLCPHYWVVLTEARLVGRLEGRVLVWVSTGVGPPAVPAALSTTIATAPELPTPVTHRNSQMQSHSPPGL